MKYIIQAKLEIEVEAQSKEEAQKAAETKLQEIEKVGTKVSEARVVDKATGYFIN